MFLLVTPAGGKLWRLKYRIDGREKLLAMGAYPEISLSEARRQREEARALIAQGKDPSREKQRDKVRSRIQAAGTFTATANEYCAKRKRDGGKGWSPNTAIRSEYLLAQLNPSIGRLAISEIEPTDVLAAVRKIEAKGNLESARRTLQLASMVFRYAVATARLRSDPTRDLRGALTAPTVRHHGAITEANQAWPAQGSSPSSFLTQSRRSGRVGKCSKRPLQGRGHLAAALMVGRIRRGNGNAALGRLVHQPSPVRPHRAYPARRGRSQLPCSR